MVKKAFTDSTLNEKIFLTSANSINVARWLPQQFYYFYAYQQWKDKNQPPIVCVPSGNFGNICAGMVAYSSGLPIKHFIAAVNANDTVFNYMQSGKYESKTAVATLSNAMDVGNPSNFIRLLELFHHRFPELTGHLSSSSSTDKETSATIRDIYKDYHYLLDPHGAVGCLALLRYLELHPGRKGIFLETAHPVKFPAAVEKITGQHIEIPPSVQQIMSAEKQSQRMPPDFDHLKQYLLH